MRTHAGLIAIALLSAIRTLQAEPASDLKRTTPVAASEQIPIADFFRVPQLVFPQINQTGTHVAALIASGDNQLLMVYDLAKQTRELLSGGAGDKDINSFTWLNDTRLLYTIETRKLWTLGIFAGDVGSLTESYPLLQYYDTLLVSVPPKDRLHPLVWNRHDQFHDDSKDLGVSVLDTEQHGAKAVNLTLAGAEKKDMDTARDNNALHLQSTYPQPTTGIVTGYMADVDGRLAYAFVQESGVPFLYRLDGRRWVRVNVDGEHVTIYGPALQPGWVVAREAATGKPRPLRLLNTVTGAWGDPLETEKTHDFNGYVYRDPVTRDLLGIYTDREYPKAIWFTDQYNALQKMLGQKFPGQFVRILGSNDAQSIFLVACYSDRQPVIYNILDLEKKTVGLFQKSLPWIDPERMRPESVIKFKTRDGHMLDAYLTLPAGASKQNPAPLVVLPHGGPHLRDSWGWDGEVQFLASRGYAVLKPNYRGSTGSDWMFTEQEQWDFLKMHEDVTDATKAALALGTVDGSRVAIMGGSFGGYLALQGVVREPDLYKCAVAISGVFDWAQVIEDAKINYEHASNDPEFQYLLYKLGDPKDNPAKFDAISPVRHIDRVKVPVFVSHGGYDSVADIGQATRLISELERHNIPFEKIIKTEESHGMQHLDNQIELYGRIEAFLARNLHPSPPTLAAPAPGQ